MHILMVLAHPLEESFAASVARIARETLEARGHTVDLLDLYREGFDPRLTVAERGSYFDKDYDASGVSPWIERLKAADGLVLVFPQWWFNFPAILKGFFDRVFAPGVAFDHDAAGGRIVPRLGNIRLFWALTSTGSPLVGRASLHGKSGAAAAEARHRRLLRQGARLPHGHSARHGSGDGGEAETPYRACEGSGEPHLTGDLFEDREEFPE